MGKGNKKPVPVKGETLKSKESLYFPSVQSDKWASIDEDIRWDLEDEGQHHYDTEDAEGNPVRLMRNLSRDSILYECEQSL
ncbi:MAG: hypothetical protein ACLFS3_02865, partial [Candidatus Aenigmatarchaeota archaeon]